MTQKNELSSEESKEEVSLNSEDLNKTCICSNCKKEIPADVTICPECDAEFIEEAYPSNFFLNAIQPILKSLDSGAFFSYPLQWIFYIFAVCNLLFPLYIGYFFIKNDSVKDFSNISVFVIWFLVAVAGWVGFQVLGNRARKFSKICTENDTFVTIPLFSHAIQTLGEWAGILLLTFGTTISVLMTIFMNGGTARHLLREFGLTMIGVGYLPAALLFLKGFLILIVSRVIAEQLKVFTTIANNTDSE